ncbi:hypothetical protein HOO69_16690 (plasmid) [Vibrio europaeus]|uniref:Uncharacterized protein n=1 Tax=Vibrio europaeus TaxID=300876 RepID=A0AAE7AX69_9VIBR|nr:hypothetical protein [Vibrio europaeus]QJY38205.1 hypothetical protein HOO69_16690 [Vibrio europaeus]
MNRILCVLSIVLSFSSFANDLNCEQLILDQFEGARILYSTEADIHRLGYQNPKLASWKEGVDKLNSKCVTEAIELPFERQIYTSDLYSLMQAYITGKGIEEWQTKFTLALVCNQAPSACEKYISKPTDTELEALWESVVN